MTAERVRELLKNYNISRGRVGHLRQEILRLERLYDRTKAELVDTLASPRAQTISDMPGGGGGVSDKVGDLAVKLADGWEPDELRAIRHQAENVKRALEDAEGEVGYVDAWIDALPAKEKHLIECRYVTGDTWARVQDDMCEWLGHDITIRGLHDVKRSAMRLIYQMAREV